MNDILIIIVAEASRKLLIVHFWFVFPLSPPSGHLVRVRHLELPAVSGPGDEVLAGFV